MSSGSCDGGPSAEWIPDLLLSPRNTIALTGFCAQDSVGGQLLALATSSPSKGRGIRGQSVGLTGDCLSRLRRSPLRIARLEGYSAHADQVGLVNWLLGADPTGRCGSVASTLCFSNSNDQDRTALHNAITERANALELESMLPALLIPIDG